MVRAGQHRMMWPRALSRDGWLPTRKRSRRLTPGQSLPLLQLAECCCGAVDRGASVSVTASTLCWTDSRPPSSLLCISEFPSSSLQMDPHSPWMFPLSQLVRLLSPFCRVLRGLRNTVANHGRDPSRRVAPMCLIIYNKGDELAGRVNTM